MKIKNRILSIFAGLTVAVSSVVAISSMADFYIDNDDAHGYSNARIGGFDTYLSGSSHYNGDARREETGKNAEYWWYFEGSGKTSSTSITVTLHAYVNHSTFTDPKANYCVNACSTNFDIGYLDQDSADAGWNYVGRRTVKPLTSIGYNSVTPTGIVVQPSSFNGYNTGADGIRVNLT